MPKWRIGAHIPKHSKPNLFQGLVSPWWGPKIFHLGKGLAFDIANLVINPLSRFKPLHDCPINPTMKTIVPCVVGG